MRTVYGCVRPCVQARVVRARMRGESYAIRSGDAVGRVSAWPGAEGSGER